MWFCLSCRKKSQTRKSRCGYQGTASAIDFSLLGEMNPGVAEALAYAKRDDVDIAAMGFANGELDVRQYYNIMSKWMSDCIMGKIDAASAMKGAADELRSKGIIDWSR